MPTKPIEQSCNKISIRVCYMNPDCMGAFLSMDANTSFSVNNSRSIGKLSVC